MSELTCPTCRASAETIVGVQVRGVYDGVLWWECDEDGTRWHRWPEGHYLRERAEQVWQRRGSRE